MIEQMPIGVTVERISIFNYILLFIFYIFIHYIIAKESQRINTILETKINDETLLKRAKMFRFFNRWFPAFYIVFIILMLSW